MKYRIDIIKVKKSICLNNDSLFETNIFSFTSRLLGQNFLIASKNPYSKIAIMMGACIAKNQTSIELNPRFGGASAEA